METPVAAPAAAPAASSPAPVSTPAPVSAPAPVTPSAPVTAAVDAPVTPAADAPVTTVTTPEPKQADFDGDIEKFLRAHTAWEDAQGNQPELVTGDEVPVAADAADTPAEKTPEEIAAEADAAADKEATPDKPAEVEAPTPEALAALIDADPETKAFIESKPELKGKLFQMARQNAKAAPILDLIPNVEAAKFAVDNANQFVGLKTAFQLSDSPEKMKEAAGQFLEQFQIMDDKGSPVLDAKGQPTYGDDLPLFVNEIKSRDNAVRIADLKERITANQFATEAGKDNAEQMLAAYEFIAANEAAGPDAFDQLDKPDTSGMTQEAKAYFERKEAELAAERERLGLKDKDLTKKGITETRTRYDTKYREEFGGGAGEFMANYLKGKEDAGVSIPRYLLQMKDPKSGISVFAQQAFQMLNQKLDKLPNVKAHSATLQMNAVNDQALAARLEYGQSLIDEHLPGIIDDLLKEAGVSMAADAKRVIDAREGKRADARVEPASGLPSSPKHMSDKQMMAEAYKTVDQRFPNIASSDRMQKALQEFNRLESLR